MEYTRLVGWGMRLPLRSRGHGWDELLSQLEEADARVKRLTVAIEQAWPHLWRPLIRAFQALRGIDWLTAATLVAECGDSRQFPHPRHLMAFLGLVPTESSSGLTQHQGGMSKTDNAHVRRVLIQGVQTYRFAPSLHAWTRGPSARRMWPPGEAALSHISWRCQQRLHDRLRRVMARRGKPQALVAVARELCRYLWEIAVWVWAQPQPERMNSAS